MRDRRENVELSSKKWRRGQDSKLTVTQQTYHNSRQLRVRGLRCQSRAGLYHGITHLSQLFWFFRRAFASDYRSVQRPVVRRSGHSADPSVRWYDVYIFIHH